MLLLWILILLTGTAFSQTVPDTLSPSPVDSLTRDTLPAEVIPRYNPLSDSVSKKPVRTYSNWQVNDSIPFSLQVLQHHPYLGFSSAALPVATAPRQTQGKEVFFYVIIALLLLFAFLKQAFAKYFNDLFRLFFRTTLKYRQIREQLMQTPLPSLLLNAFFVICAALYACFLLLHYELIEREEYWRYFLYSCIGLSAIYFVKFIGLKVIGWIFNMRDAADSYIFVVFVINKVIGVFLLPFIVMLAFMSGTGYSIALVLSWFGIGALILYRFILSYAAVRNQVRFNPFHFFLYLCAFEIAPLLLIYKALLVFFQ